MAKRVPFDAQPVASLFPDESSETIRVGCKINLSLRIVGVRPDGWHELDTLFVPLDEPHDELELTSGTQPGLSVICTLSAVDVCQNTLTAAYARYAAATGFQPALTVTLRKGIPHGAGLGGGSADAAALLLWLNTHCPRPLEAPALNALAANVGADVPFFLRKGPCRATGVGEILAPSACLDELGLRGVEMLLLCPPVTVSTPAAYAAWDVWQKKRNSDLTGKSEGRIYRLSQGFARGCQVENDPSGSDALIWLENSFEVPVFEGTPSLRHFKEQLFQAGAFAAAMSGSGSSLFGLFRSADTEAIAASFREKNVAVYRYVL